MPVHKQERPGSGLHAADGPKRRTTRRRLRHLLVAARRWVESVHQDRDCSGSAGRRRARRVKAKLWTASPPPGSCSEASLGLGHSLLGAFQLRVRAVAPIRAALEELPLPPPESLQVLVRMNVLRGTTGKKKVAACCVDNPLPYAIEDNYGVCFLDDDDDDDLAQVLQDQEILYQLIQANDGRSSSRAHSAPSSSYVHDWKSNEPKLSGCADFELQLAVDEALARELQEMEGQLANTSLTDSNGQKPTPYSLSNHRNSPANRSPQVVADDGIDPDNMTYEELQQLGEAIGTESKGLPESLIALLPTSTFKIGIFSRKEKYDECVICCIAYKNRDRLTKLPCEHQYHQTCVSKWLQINKVCPVCNKEVFGK